MLRRSSDQEKAIWAGLHIALLVRQGHTPDTSQDWERVGRFKRLHAHYVVLSHPDQTVAEKTQQAIEIAVGTVVDCSCKKPNYIHVPKP
jgi:hypothetical protein